MTLHSISSDDSDVPLAEILAKRRRITHNNKPFQPLSKDFSDSSEEIITLYRLSTCRNNILSSSEDEDNESSIDNVITSYIDWFDPIGNQPRFTPFVDTPGFRIFNQTYEKPEDIYLLLVNDESFELVVMETNRCTQTMLSEETSS